MSESPLVSIVTPSFNMGRYLERTMRSVLDQDYPRIEYIVMDGGSTDGSVEIIRKYQDRLAYWTSGPDAGQSAAVTAGWRRSRGEIIAEIDASDLLGPHSVGRAVEAFAQHPEWAMLYSDAIWVDEADRCIGRYAAREFDVADMLCGNYVPQPTVFIRRSCFEEVGGYDPTFEMSMDFDLWMRIGRQYPVGYLANETLGWMRQHEDSKTLKKATRWLEENVRVIDATLDFGPWTSQRKKIRPRAIGCALARHAGYCTRDGAYGEARRALWALARTRTVTPWRRYGHDLRGIAATAFLGSRMVTQLRRIKGIFDARA